RCGSYISPWKALENLNSCRTWLRSFGRQRVHWTRTRRLTIPGDFPAPNRLQPGFEVRRRKVFLYSIVTVSSLFGAFSRYSARTYVSIGSQMSESRGAPKKSLH